MPGTEEIRAKDPDVHYDQLAVAFLDIVGFSALMGEDERATFDRWSRLRTTVVLPILEKYEGHFVKSTGDGLLATFRTALNAVQWATEVQQKARSQGEGLRMRIALNYGPTIVDSDQDIAGDCVNIAARLEQHALPGGTIITSQFRDSLYGSDDFDLQPAGELKLKNIRQKVQAFHLNCDARLFADRKATPVSSRLPSIAILPLESHDIADYFCNGIVDDLIVSLSGVQELAVIARSTAKAVGPQRGQDARDVGEALGVDYLLTGALQRIDQQMRAAFILTETATGGIVASEKFTFPMDELFSIQDQIVEKIVGRITPEVRSTTLQQALRKPPQNFSAYEHLLRALEKVSSLDRQEFEAAREHLDQAIEEDPTFAMPHAWSARWRTLRVGQGWSEDPEADSLAAVESARRAIKLDRRNALALASYGHVCAYLDGDYETAISYLDRAIEAGPNNATARVLRSGTLSFLGRASEAREEAQLALRLSPFDEQLFHFYGFMALACYVDDDFTAAVRWAQRGRMENPNYTHTLKVLVVSCVGAGKLDAAKAAAEELMAMEPTFRLANYQTRRAPFHEKHRVDTLIERFFVAGLSE